MHSTHFRYASHIMSKGNRLFILVLSIRNVKQEQFFSRRYLEEAVMNLDASNPVTREHMTTVLGALGQKLMAFIQNHPQEKMTRNIKMLLMASQSLLK